MRIFLLGITLPFALHAQTNSPAPASNAATVPIFAASAVETNSPALTNSPVRAPTDISAAVGYFDFKTRQAIYTGNVRVTDPQMNLTCELLTVVVPAHGGRIDYIVAETNVVIDAMDGQGRPVHAIADKAVYSYKATNSDTNEILELTGHPRIESPFGPSTGDPIVWNRTKDTVRAFNVGQAFQPPAPKPRTNAASTLPTGQK